MERHWGKHSPALQNGYRTLLLLGGSETLQL
jgi:hypothetical protein